MFIIRCLIVLSLLGVSLKSFSSMLCASNIRAEVVHIHEQTKEKVNFKIRILKNDKDESSGRLACDFKTFKEYDLEFPRKNDFTAIVGGIIDLKVAKKSAMTEAGLKEQLFWDLK